MGPLRKPMMSSSAADARIINCKSNVLPLAITRTNGPWTHTYDDSYIYQLPLVLVTATISEFSDQMAISTSLTEPVYTSTYLHTDPTYLHTAVVYPPNTVVVASRVISRQPVYSDGQTF